MTDTTQSSGRITVVSVAFKKSAITSFILEAYLSKTREKLSWPADLLLARLFWVNITPSAVKFWLRETLKLIFGKVLSLRPHQHVKLLKMFVKLPSNNSQFLLATFHWDQSRPLFSGRRRPTRFLLNLDRKGICSIFKKVRYFFRAISSSGSSHSLQS